MPNNIETNASIFGHILLDSELKGRWGVQGNTFANTIGYLNQYFETLPKNHNGDPHIPGLNNEKLTALSTALLNLVTHENVLDPSQLIKDTQDGLVDLPYDEDYMLPGGWRGRKGGHGMIYQFHKIPATENFPEKWRFSIYNAGAGLDKHEKQSTTTNETYFPIKTYEIPTENLNQREFQLFIQHLIAPRYLDFYEGINPEYRDYNEQKLYRNIEKSLPFLNNTDDFTQKAQLIPASTIFPEHFNTMTTAGQISGTCAQRSIHQMLKVNFDHLRDYQRFIFNFEMYALKDFIYQPSQDAPQKRSQGIIDLIELGIDNLLKILQEPNVFTDQEQQIFHAELSQLRNEANLLVLEKDIAAIGENTEINTRNNTYSCEARVTTDFSSIATSAAIPLPTQEPLPPINNPETVLNNIQTLLARCQATMENQPRDLMWVIDQIERVINTLPIPENEQAFQNGMELYHHFNVEQLKQMVEMLANLQELYIKTTTSKTGSGIYPNTQITRCSFLTLHDYFLTQYVNKACVASPVFPEQNAHLYLKKIFHEYFEQTDFSPYWATNNPLLDQRLVALRKTYAEPIVSPPYKYNAMKSTYELNITGTFNLMQLYQALLCTEPECLTALTALYKQNPASQEGGSSEWDWSLNRILTSKKREALYYLFEQLDNEGNILSDSPLNHYTNENGNLIDFTSLLIKIQSAIQMEKAWVRTFSSNPIKSDKLSIEKKGSQGCQLISSDNALGTGNHFGFHKTDDYNSSSIYSHKYNLKKSPVEKALLSHISSSVNQPISANNIQLAFRGVTQGGALNKEDFFIRQLYHLQSSPGHRIVLTLNYFMRHISRLSNIENQCYVEATLFEPGALINILDAENFTQEPNFLTQFDDFLQKALDTFNDHAKNITPESLFFVQLSNAINRYILAYARLSDNKKLFEIAQARLTNDLVLINEQISVQNDTSILASLHQCRFYTLISLSQEAIETTEVLEQCLASYFYQQAHENSFHPEDKASTLMRQHVERLFQSYLQQADKTSLETIIKKVICQLLAMPPENINNFNITGSYPHYVLQNIDDNTEYTVNIEQGRIFTGPLTLCDVPLVLKSHALLKQLGIEETTACFVSQDGNIFEFHPIGLRIKKSGDLLTVQKQWMVNSIAQWYELQPLTNEQKLVFSSSIEPNLVLSQALPLSLSDGDAKHWINTNNSRHSFIAKNNQPQYELAQQADTEQVTCKKIADTDETREYYLNANSAYHAVLSRFESSSLEISLAKQPDENGIAYLPRYGLTFELNNQCIKLANTHYVRDISHRNTPPSPFKSDIAHLILSDETEEPTNKKNQLCIVPVQRFYLDENKQITGERNQFTHDVSNYIGTNQFDKLRNHSTQYSAHQWHYNNSAESISFTLIEGKPRPNNAADALYLCYLYLGSSEPEKAWKVLEDISIRLPLEGNYQEIMYFSWIINALPIMLTDHNDKTITHEHAPLGSPRDVACQLKALALCTDFLAQGKKFSFPRKDTRDMTTANSQYEKLDQEAIKKFYDNVPRTIYEKYSTLLKMRDHLSESYTLQDAECKSLLRCYHKSLSNGTEQLTLRGTLGYEYRRLTLKTLLIEQERLKALLAAQQAMGHPVSKALKKRVADIQQEINEQSDIMKYETRLEVYPIDLSLPEEAIALIKNKCNYTASENSIFPDSNRYGKFALPTATANDNALFILYSNVHADDVFQHIKSYFFIAANDPSHEDYKKLRQFCVNYLIAYSNQSQADKDVSVYYLVNLLYRVMHQPDCLKNADDTWKTNQTLERIFAAVRHAPVTPIEIRQAKDIFATPLKKTQEIVTELLEKMPTVKIPRSVMKATTVELFKGVIPDTEINLFPLQDVIKPAFTTHHDFTQFCTDHIQAENEYQETLKALKRQLTLLEKENINHNIKEKAAAEIEQLAGEAQYQCIERQRELSLATLNSSDTRTVLRAAALAEKERIDKLLDTKKETEEVTLWEKAIALANSMLIQRPIKLDAKQVRLFTKEDLLKLYFDDDLALLLEKTGLDMASCQQLRQNIHQCLLLEVQRQQAVRLITALDDLNRDLAASPEDAQPNAFQLANIATIFMSQNLSDAAHDPVMMLFQYEEDMLLRPRQLEALKNLFETSPDDPHAFNQAVERVIMGGGKSKVLLPLLAQKKATGLNLVIVEVPQALLATNHMDLNGTSQRLFNQKACRFEFNRDSDSSPQRLEEIYYQFLDIITNKDYLVTTGESMQSLQLKYIEIMASPMPTNEAECKIWEKRVEWASKLSELLKERGDVIIDEAHDGLLFKKKMNYVMGLPEVLAPAVIHHTIDLYQFMHVLAESTLPVSTQQNTIHPECVKNQWLEISQNKENLIYQLLENPSSPLKVIIEKLIASLLSQYTRKAIMAELAAYLMEQHEPTLLITADPTFQDAFAFYKEQLRLLPQTLDRRYKENYGPSQNNQKSSLERTLAIPYAANDKPNERSRFGNSLEILNYSTQALLMEGLTLPLLIRLIEDWQTQARAELQQNPKYGSLDNTPIAQKFIRTIHHAKYTSLKSIDVKNTQQMIALLKQVHHQPNFLFELLENHVLPQITTESAILHSDAINHVSMYHSVQAVSGTPDNHRTFGRLKYNKHASLGTRGYIQQVLKMKNTPIHGVDFTDLKSYLENLYTTSQRKESTHAIMDICATFRGKSNLEVAKALANSSFCKRKTKYILYFKTIKRNNQESDVLYAYDIKTKKSIRLDDSHPDKINQMLDCKPDERFTYYDQIHTTGVDLKQPLQSNGLCLVDEKTKEFFQGAYRMRDLAEQQTVEIIVPTKMAHIPLNDLMQTMASNEEYSLKEDNFYATLAKLNNIIREQALSYIARINHKDASTKKALEAHFEQYFIEKKISHLWQQYGTIYHEEESDKLFDQHAKNLIEGWRHCIKKLSPIESERAKLNDEIIQTGIETMVIAMNEIIVESLPFCHKKGLSPQRNNGQEVELQEETQKEQEQHEEQEKQKEEEAECYRTNLFECNYMPWTQNLNSFGCSALLMDDKSIFQGFPENFIGYIFDQSDDEDKVELFYYNKAENNGKPKAIEFTYDGWDIREKLGDFNVFLRKISEKSQKKPAVIALSKDDIQTIISFTKDVHSIIWVHPLNELLSSSFDHSEIYTKPLNFFSPNLIATENYSHVFHEQKHFFGPLTKPVHAILFRQTIDPSTQQPIITACLISNQELEELTLLLKENPVNGLWIGTTQHDVLAGKRPHNININTNQAYCEFIEQIQFFDGQCNVLTEQKTPLYWLDKDTKRKLDYLENKIIPYRETSITDFKLLQERLNQKNVALVYIHQHAANDLTQCNWKEQFPKLAEADAAMLEETALIYQQINQAWQKYTSLPPSKKKMNFSYQIPEKLPEDVANLLRRHISELNNTLKKDHVTKNSSSLFTSSAASSTSSFVTNVAKLFGMG